MNVRELMTTEVITATPETTLEEVAAMMKIGDTGVIPVVEEDELIGLITDRDIVIRCVAEGRDPAEVSAEEIVSDDMEVVDPETDVEEALEIMGRRQVRRLPVVDMGELVGMLSIGDIAVKQGNKQEAGETLKDVSQGVKDERRRPQAAVRTVNTATRNATSDPQGEATTGITNDIDEEVRRQDKVVSIRPDANSLPRGQKKSSKTKAS